MSRLLDNLVFELGKLPGVGRRSALRLALHILRADLGEADALAGAIYEFRRNIKYCVQCNNLTEGERCEICEDPRRERTMVCVVEHVGDLLSIESTGSYNGLYHVLGGVISPMAGISPSDLRIDLLIHNVEQGVVKEVILALPTTMEGETTAFYISRRLAGCQVKLTTISRGIGLGDEIEYADQLTVSHAIRNRKALGGS
ncbi:MAG: recombination mediator RecR, partial [Mucinivorans sp.]